MDERSSHSELPLPKIKAKKPGDVPGFFKQA